MNDEISKDIDNFFKISKLKYRELKLKEVIDSINQINKIDVTGEDFYEKKWIKIKLRKDIPEIDLDSQNFGNKKNSLFVVPAIINN